MQEALLSVLAGDIYGKTPIGRSLLGLKCVYYLISLANLKRTFMAWRSRRHNIRNVDAIAGR
jgi:hypothetical protein